MAQNIPPEIMDLVLGEYRPENRAERETIAHCGLVCKNWLSASRYRLFSDAKFDDRTIESFFSVVEKSPFPLPAFIRSLQLSSARRDGSFCERLWQLAPFSQVKTLRISMDELALNSTLLANIFPDISTLIFQGYRPSFSSVLNAMASFPSVQTLGLEWVSLSYAKFSPLAYRSPPRWNALTVNFHHQAAIEELFETILSLNPIPIFSALSVHGTYPTHSSYLTKYLRHAGGRVQYLCLGSNEYLTSTAIGLRHSTGLRCLDLVFHHNVSFTQRLENVLPNLCSRNLVTINITSPYTGTMIINASHWARLDEALVDEHGPLAQLRTFRIKSASPRFVDSLLGRMPLSKARGIFQVENLYG
ncbi:hypothetical protein B0H11DRAFT_1256059 [Mycena galericulata]|nr:hypothetical protein B0H11DRAFT_1256059 [Mycena galericulata]